MDRETKIGLFAGLSILLLIVIVMDGVRRGPGRGDNASPATLSAPVPRFELPPEVMLSIASVAGAIRVEEEVADPFKRASAISPRWRYIILHHSGADTSTVENMTEWHVKHLGWRAMGYHFVIMPDGVVRMGERWLKQWEGAHCKGLNTDGIGVCLVGNLNEHPPTRAQAEATAALVGTLQQALGIPMERTLRHGNLAATECPGSRFMEPPQ